MVLVIHSSTRHSYFPFCHAWLLHQLYTRVHNIYKRTLVSTLQVDYPRFNLPKNVASLLYGQALVWLVVISVMINHCLNSI